MDSTKFKMFEKGKWRLVYDETMQVEQ